MRAHTGPEIKVTLALAPGPTAAGFLGNRVRGSAPACGTGGSLVLPGGVARGGGDVGFGALRTLVVDFGWTGNMRRLLVVAVVGAVDVAAAVAVRAEDVVASIAAGEPVPQPARTRQVSQPAVVVALVVLLRGIVRSVRLGRPW